MLFPRAGALGLLALLPLLPAAGTALQEEPGLTVSEEWLAAHLNDENLVILHVGDGEGYQAGHIPGARLISLGAISAPVEADSNDLRLEMPSSEDLRAAFEGFGVHDDSRIVVYFGTDWVTPATRVVFTLDYLGLGDRTSFLDGGMPAWTGAGRPLSKEVPEVAEGHLTPREVRGELLVDAAFVQDFPGDRGHQLVDARDLVFYDGTRPTNDREGHIPGAASVPFTQAVDEDLVWDQEKLAEAFRAAGIQAGDTVVAYCHIGQQATTVLFGARLLGHPVKLYDGSFQDWAKRDLPVERGSGG